MEEQEIKNKLPEDIEITEKNVDGEILYTVSYTSKEMKKGFEGKMFPKFGYCSSNRKLIDALQNILSNLKLNNTGYEEETRTFK